MPSIAVIDDDEKICQVIQEILQCFGHEAKTYLDAAPFLESKSFTEVDLIITDLIMPTSGECLVRKLHQQKCGVPTVVMAGNIPDATRRTLQAAGVQSLLDKPFTIETLMQAVEQTLEGAPLH